MLCHVMSLLLIRADRGAWTAPHTHAARSVKSPRAMAKAQDLLTPAALVQLMRAPDRSVDIFRRELTISLGFGETRLRGSSAGPC
jgi:hypothetical protein